MLDKRAVTWLREERAHIRNRAVDLCTWKIVLPGLLLLLFWPIYGCIMEVQRPFVRAFAHGDYVLFAALLLFEVSVEGERLVMQTAMLRVMRNALRIAAISMILVFGFMKYDVVIKEARLPTATGVAATTIDAKLRSYSCFSCALAFLTVVYSLYASVALVERESADLFHRLGDGR